jgi:hypothetical protein
VTEKRICKACDLNFLTCIDTGTECINYNSPLYLSGATCVEACLDQDWGRNIARTCSNNCTELNEYGDLFDKKFAKSAIVDLKHAKLVV